jgi:hypothetical protein
MRKVSLSIAYLGILTLLLGGCNSGGSSNSNNAISTNSPAPEASPPSPSPVAIAPTPQPATTIAAPGLIQSTNPDDRARQVQKGRTDPFAVFPTQAIVSVDPAKEVPAVPNLPSSSKPAQPQYFVADCPGQSNVPSQSRLQCRYPVKPTGSGQVATNQSQPQTVKVTATRPKPNAVKVTATRPKPNAVKVTATRPKPNAVKVTATRPKPNAVKVTANQPNPDTIPSLGLPPVQSPGSIIPPGQTSIAPPTGLPPEPAAIQEPELAKRVEVTGVVEVGGRMYAIVKAPNETASRYVQAGDTLSDGQVTVQRIEMNEGSAPSVVLAQFGVEVTRSVGDKAETTSASVELTQPSASNNLEQPSANNNTNNNLEQPSANNNILENRTGTVPPIMSVTNPPQMDNR